VEVDIFAQQLDDLSWRLAKLYQGAHALIEPPPDLLPVAFKELGIASEELQVAVEELQVQNQELADARAAVETERQRYQDLFEFAPDGYLLTDAAGTIREANRAAAKLLNVEQRFLVGKPLVIFVTEDERQKFHSQLNAQEKSKQVQEWAVRLAPRNGEPVDAAVTVATIRDKEDKVVGLRVCVRDVSDRHRQEAGREIPSQDRPRHLYLKGDTIPLKPQTIWQVCQGIVKLSTICENGEEVVVGLAGPAMVFGPDLTSLNTYQATALGEVQLVCFSLTDIAASPSLIQSLLPQIQRRLRQTEAILAISGQRRVKDRFCELLQLLKQEIGQPVAQGIRLSVRLTHQDLADACSTTRVTITRLLGKLQQQGKITLDSKNHIIVRDQGFESAYQQKA
jgi:PAS domain S-box-containing protein